VYFDLIDVVEGVSVEVVVYFELCGYGIGCLMV